MINYELVKSAFLALFDTVKYLASMDSVRQWFQKLVSQPISNIYARCYVQEGVAEGAEASILEGVQFVEEPSICETLSRELGDSSAARVVGIWAPSGTGKTFTISNLMMKARQQEQGSIIRYERIDWSKYHSYSHGRTMSQWMEFWRTVAGPGSDNSSFTVLFMDHFDDAMSVSNQNNSATKFIGEMIHKARNDRNLAILFCVNDLHHAKAIKYTLQLYCQPGDVENFSRMIMHCGSSVEQQPVMMWKSCEAARQYAGLVLCAYTAAQAKKRVVQVDWGAGNSSDQPIDKLTDLVLADGCVKRAISFLQGDGWDDEDVSSPLHIDAFIEGAVIWRKQEWEDKLINLQKADSLNCRHELRLFIV